MIHNRNENHPATRSIELSTLQKAYFMGRRQDFDLHVHTHVCIEHKFPGGTLDLARLQSAFDQLHLCHDMLSATVHEDARIHFPLHPRHQKIQVHNLKMLNAAEATEQSEAIRRSVLRSDFDIQNGLNMGIYLILQPEADLILLNFNLMVLDGAAIRKLCQDLSRLYSGEVTQLTRIPFDTEDFTAKAKELKNSDRYKRTLDYWTKQLDSFPSGPIFPDKRYIGKPRRSDFTRRKHILEFAKWEVLVNKAEELSITTTAMMLSAFSLILSFWSKNQYFSITMLNYNMGGQKGGQSEIPIGNYSATTLTRLDHRNRKTLEELIKDTHKEVFFALTKSLVCGLDVLQEKNRTEKSTFRAASPVAFVSMIKDGLGQVDNDMFQFEAANSGKGGLETPQVLIDHQVMTRHDGGVALNWDTIDAAFEPLMIDDMFAAYTALIESMVSDSAIWKQSHFDFRSPTDKEKHRVYNLTQGDIAKKCLHELFYEQAEKTPDNAYIVSQEQSFSYEAARHSANQLADLLRNTHQTRPNELVAIYAGKGWQQPVAALGILISGSAYVPIDPKQPLQRTSVILKHCKCRVVLTTSAYVADEALAGLHVINIDDYRLAKPSANLATAQQPEDVAYVIFTSGSTGTPKGVTLDNIGPVNTILDINQRIQLSEKDVIFGLSELNFDLSVYDIFGAASRGATLLIPPDGAGRNPALCAQLIDQHKVTVWNSVPALAQLLAEYLQLSGHQLQHPVPTFMLSGDWIPITLPDALKKNGATTVMSLGGATEASIWSIYYPIERVDPEWKSIPYGYPLTNQTFFVLDEKYQPRPDNVPGELYIGGIGVAKEYWGDPEKTAASYVLHPESGERIYRTGDWGVRRSAGHIDFLGREDGQVKVRGYRIELGEIETALQLHTKVQNGVVKVIGKNAQEAYIAAYWVAMPDTSVTEAEIASFVAAYVPVYMVPSRFIQLPALPLGATGKVDRKALPDPETNSANTLHNPPQTPTEIALADLWCQILNLTTINQCDNFFELGGNSFDAVRLTVLINSTFNREIFITELLKSPRLGELASVLDTQQQDDKQAFSNLVTIANNPANPSCFLFHPSGGNILCYQEMAKQLSATFNVVGVQAYIGANQAQFPTFSDMITNYVHQVRQQQPTGPYYLGGWSMGGVIAYAAAQYLIEAGESIAALWLLDSPLPEKRAIPDAKGMLEWFISDLLQVDVVPDLDCMKQAHPNIRQAIAELQAREMLPKGAEVELENTFACFSVNITLLHGYTARELDTDIPVLLAMATQQVEDRVPRCSGSNWLKLFQATTTTHIELQTNHYGMVQAGTLSKIIPHLIAK